MTYSFLNIVRAPAQAALWKGKKPSVTENCKHTPVCTFRGLFREQLPLKKVLRQHNLTKRGLSQLGSYQLLNMASILNTKFTFQIQATFKGVYHAAAAAKSLQSCPTLRPHRRQPTRLPHPSINHNLVFVTLKYFIFNIPILPAYQCRRYRFDPWVGKIPSLE